jgi:hypothetical protein
MAEMYQLGMLNAANCAEHMGADHVAEAIRKLAANENVAHECESDD